MRREQSGFRPVWLWIPFLAVVVFVAVIFVVGSGARKSRPGTDGNASTKIYQEDRISFRYPSDWELSAPGWKDEPSGGRRRHLTLKSDDGLVGILQFQGTKDVSLTKATEKLGLGVPVSEKKVVATIAGETVMGIQKDLVATFLTVKVPMRVRMYKLQQSDQIILIMLTARVEIWAHVEPKFKTFLESFEIR